MPQSRADGSEDLCEAEEVIDDVISSKQRSGGIGSRSTLKIRPKKTEVERIMAITDHFLSTIDEASFEYYAVYHTVEFFCHLNNLVRQGYLRTFIQKNNPTTRYYLAMVDYSIVEEIAEDLDIHLYEYLFRGSIHHSLL